MPFRTFLADQAKALDDVHDRPTLAAWHRRFATEWTKDARALAASANGLLRLTGDYAVRDDLGYLAVERQPKEGRSEPWILLCANPGWVAESNALERALKGQQPAEGGGVDVEAYEAYRTSFFDRWYPEVLVPSGRKNGAGWWNKGARFLHQVDDLEKPKGTMVLHRDFDVIGWDLWPFHSSRDGFSRWVAEGDQGIVAFARASLKAALRVSGTRGVIAASAAAKQIVDGLLADEPSSLQSLGSRTVSVTSTLADGQERRSAATISSFECGSSGRKLIVIDRQLFSNWGTPSRKLNGLIVDAVRFAARGERLEGGSELAHAAQEPCVRFMNAQPSTRPLVLAVPVCQNDKLDAPDHDDENEMHTRTVGFWPRKPAGALLQSVRAAFSSGQRVFVMSRCSGRILRLYEVIPGPDERRPNHFEHSETKATSRTFTLDSPQPAGLEFERQPFASCYRYEGQGQQRIRFHARPCSDEALRGVAIDSLDTAMNQGPAQRTFADLEDPRVKELLEGSTDEERP
jgi:hypothetical protein